MTSAIACSTQHGANESGAKFRLSCCLLGWPRGKASEKKAEDARYDPGIGQIFKTDF